MHRADCGRTGNMNQALNVLLNLNREFGLCFVGFLGSDTIGVQQTGPSSALLDSLSSFYESE